MSSMLLRLRSLGRPIKSPLVRSFATSSPPPSPPRSRLAISACSALFATGITYYVMEVQQHEALLEQRQILTGDVDHASVAVAERDALPIIQKMRSDPDMTEIDPYARMKGSARLNSLTASTLNGKGMLVAPPVVFYNKDRTEVMAVTHLGKQLCGHDGIIHGGMLATLLDEILACAAMPALPGNVGFTANLNINYRRPVQSHQWVVLRGRLDRAEGRKAFVEAWIEDLDGNKCVEATSLYIAPKTPLARIL